MNAPLPFAPDVKRQPLPRNSALAPAIDEALDDAGTPIMVRDMRFGRARQKPDMQSPDRWWLNGDPVATAWFNALSATFPRGEAFFIEAVKAHRDGVPPALAADIRAFVAQEINHTREHLAFNRSAESAGYDLSRIDRRVAELLALTRDRPVIVNLAATMALEHYTAMMAHHFLRDAAHLAGAEPAAARLWTWHAIEEIEHKAVAHDTWLHATRDWSRWRRWRLKSLMMLIVTKNFLVHRFQDTLDLLAQDGLPTRGLAGFRIKGRLLAYLLWKPGILRRIAPQWLAYFLPGFHPWQVDDRHLVAEAQRRLDNEPA